MISSKFINESQAYTNSLSDLLISIQQLESKIQNQTASNHLLVEHPISEEIHLNMERLKKELKNLDVKLNLCVFGKFNSGKSSFINALLGKELADVNEIEWTYSLNYITYGMEELATINKVDGSKSSFKHSELTAILRANRNDLAFKENIESIEMTFPYPEIKDINIWDTPGLGSTTVINREKALSIMEKSDVILWIIDGGYIGDADDKSYINLAKSMGKPIICIVNKMDLNQELDSKNRTLQFIADNYVNSFSEVFLVSSIIIAHPDTTSSGISEVRNYLESKVFSKKKEIVIGSTTTSLRNINHNIQSLLNQFIDKLNENIQKYSDFSEELASRTKDILPEIKKFIDNYVTSDVFEEEYHSLLNRINTTPINSKEELEKMITTSINESKTTKYIDNIYSLIKSRIESNWNTAIVLSSDVLATSDKYFHISHNSVLATSSYENNLKEEVVNDLALKIGIVAGSLTSVSMIASGTALLTSMLSGVAVVGVALWAAWEIVGSTVDKSQSNRLKLKEKIDELKDKFRTDIVDGKIFPRLKEAHSQMTAKVLMAAEEKIFNTASLNECNSIIDHIKLFEAKSVHLAEEIDSIYDSIAEENEIFQKRLKLENFIIERENPNPGIEKLIKVLSSASQYVYIIDPYFQEASLNWLRHINSSVAIKVLLYYLDEHFDQHPSFISKLDSFRKKRTASILIRMIRYKYQKGTPIHDRFIFTKNWCIQLGNGLDAIGKQDISISFVEEDKMFQDKYFNKYWNATSIKFEDKERAIVKLDF